MSSSPLFADSFAHVARPRRNECPEKCLASMPAAVIDRRSVSTNQLFWKADG
jgi:hypothetical protein